jgi:hypothetical protein
VIFLRIGPCAEAVLEIDAEILDRLARQLVDDPRMDAVSERGVESKCLRQRRRRRRVFVERFERGRAELLRDIRRKQVRAAVDRVDRLARLGRL